jgi:hypothetical protein
LETRSTEKQSTLLLRGSDRYRAFAWPGKRGLYKNSGLHLFFRASGLLVAGTLFPFLDIGVSQALRSFLAPRKTEASQSGIKHQFPACRAAALNIVFPEFNRHTAARTAMVFDVRKFPAGGIHTGTFGHE